MDDAQHQQGEEDDEQQHENILGGGCRQIMTDQQTIGDEQQHCGQHAKIGIPVTVIIRVIPVERTGSIGE